MEKKYKVGYTSGVFDMFHIGHLNILRRAKEHCDYLIVGVCTDELVKEYKHKTPVIPYEERAAIVEAIKFVDQVVPQTNRDKVLAHKEHKFDVVFLGDDWKGSEYYIETEKKLNDLGVDLVFFPYTKGTSSTKLAEVLEKLRKTL